MINPLSKNLSLGGVDSRVVTQTQISGASFQGGSPQINIGQIVGIDVKKMTCDVRTVARGVVIADAMIASSSNSLDHTMFSTPIVGQSCILITSSDLYNIVIPIGLANSGNSLPTYSGENIVKGKGGQLHSQDASGNQVFSANASVIDVQGRDGVKTEVSIGRHEKTSHSETLSGMARTGFDHSSDISSGSIVKGTNIERYYSSIETGMVNSPEFYITSQDGNPYIKIEEKMACLTRASESMVNINYLRTSLNELRVQMYSKSMTENEYLSVVASIKAKIKTDFRIKKNLSLVVEKGTVLNSNPETVREISNIDNSSVAKSCFGKDIVYRVKVVSPVTGLKLGGIYFDEEGNCMIDCNNFLVNAKYNSNIYSDSNDTGEYIAP